jgi:hypothetical protein
MSYEEVGCVVVISFSYHNPSQGAWTYMRHVRRIVDKEQEEKDTHIRCLIYQEIQGRLKLCVCRIVAGIITRVPAQLIALKRVLVQ